jgi:nucleotide-binding universal stress UspA family protein
MKILIGYDGSACADSAILDLRRAGLPATGEALLVSAADLVVEVPFAGYEELDSPYKHVPANVVRESRAAAAAAMEAARGTAHHGADRLASVLPRWNLTNIADAESPHWSLVRRAEQWRADLVIVGTHGRSALGRMVMGSVSQSVVHHSPCSVRVGRSRAEPAQDRRLDDPTRIILGTDGSVDSAFAIEALRARVWPTGTEVHVVTAVDLQLVASDFEGWSAADADGRLLSHVARRRANAVVRELRDDGLAAEPFVVEGDPKHVLLEHAQTWDADCIMLGARGHTRRERFLLGSVSAAVVARAHCTVEIVRRR